MKKSKIRSHKLPQDAPKPTPPKRRPRENWRELFRAAGAPDDDSLLPEDMTPNRFDLEEWEW